MSIKCGKCKMYHYTTDDVRACHQGQKVPVHQESEVDRDGSTWEPEVAGEGYRVTPRVRPPQEAGYEVTEGMWKLGNRIIKMQIAHHGSGRLYGKELLVSNDPDESGLNRVPEHRWEKVVGAERMLRQEGGRRMTLEEAQEFGQLYGFCCRCGAILTDETSIEAGIGPKCAQRFADA